MNKPSKPQKYPDTINMPLGERMWNECCDKYEAYEKTLKPLDEDSIRSFLDGWGLNKTSELAKVISQHFKAPTLDQKEVEKAIIHWGKIKEMSTQDMLDRGLAKAICSLGLVKEEG